MSSCELRSKEAIVLNVREEQVIRIKKAEIRSTKYNIGRCTIGNC